MKIKEELLRWIVENIQDGYILQDFVETQM